MASPGGPVATGPPGPADALRGLLDEAAGGRFPEPDGSITVLPPDRTTGLHAVLSFTAHVVVVTDLHRDEVMATGIDAYGGATDPTVLLTLAGGTHRCGVLDIALVRRGTATPPGDTVGPTGDSSTVDTRSSGDRIEPTAGAPGGSSHLGVVETDRHDAHPRVRYARELRRDVRVFADDRGLITIGRGLGGRHELGVELFGEEPGGGHGATLLRAALGLVGTHEWLYAACAPGNARSLRALLAAGFVPFGSEVLLSPVGR